MQAANGVRQQDFSTGNSYNWFRVDYLHYWFLCRLFLLIKTSDFTEFQRIKIAHFVLQTNVDFLADLWHWVNQPNRPQNQLSKTQNFIYRPAVSHHTLNRAYLISLSRTWTKLALDFQLCVVVICYHLLVFANIPKQFWQPKNCDNLYKLNQQCVFGGWVLTGLYTDIVGQTVSLLAS